MLRKIWLEDMVRVSFDALEKVVVSSIDICHVKYQQEI